MKQSVKYLLLLILLLAMHLSVWTGVEATTDAPVAKTETGTSLSQAPTRQQLLNDLYNHIASQAVCLDVVDTPVVPAYKVMRLLASCVQTFIDDRDMPEPADTYQPQILSGNPHKYYLFGLRKLLI